MNQAEPDLSLTSPTSIVKQMDSLLQSAEKNPKEEIVDFPKENALPEVPPNSPMKSIKEESFSQLFNENPGEEKPKNGTRRALFSTVVQTETAKKAGTPRERFGSSFGLELSSSARKPPQTNQFRREKFSLIDGLPGRSSSMLPVYRMGKSSPAVTSSLLFPANRIAQSSPAVTSSLLFPANRITQSSPAANKLPPRPSVRTSLFPNGQNPLDTPIEELVALKKTPKKCSTGEEEEAREQSETPFDVRTSASVDRRHTAFKAPISSILSSAKKSNSKSVRFAESADLISTEFSENLPTLSENLLRNSPGSSTEEASTSESTSISVTLKSVLTKAMHSDIEASNLEDAVNSLSNPEFQYLYHVIKAAARKRGMDEQPKDEKGAPTSFARCFSVPTSFTAGRSYCGTPLSSRPSSRRTAFLRRDSDEDEEEKLLGPVDG